MILWVGWVVILSGDSLPGAGWSKVASFPYLGLQLGWPLWLGPAFMRLSSSWRLARLTHMTVKSEGWRVPSSRQGRATFFQVSVGHMFTKVPSAKPDSRFHRFHGILVEFYLQIPHCRGVRRKCVAIFCHLSHRLRLLWRWNIGDRCESVMKIRSGPVRRSNASQSIVGINI